MSMAEVAYRESVRAIESQDASLAELRSRTSLVFAAAALSVSVLGSAAVDDGLGPAEWVGVSLLALMAVALAVIALPQRWKSRMSGADIVGDWVDANDGSTLEELYRDLAIHLTDAMNSNQATLNRLSWVFAVAVGLALGSIVAFGYALL